MMHLLSKPVTVLTALAAFTLGGCVTDSAPFNRGAEAVHQPVVRYVNYVYDIQPGPRGGLSDDERDRLEGWLQSIAVGYGDQIAIADSSLATARMRKSLAALFIDRGLYLGEDGSGMSAAPGGKVRLIVRRASAGVPGCPDWSDNAEANGFGSMSTNFGCGVNSNIAQMVADPRDLIAGKSSDTILRTATSNRAIQTYRDKEPTGSGDLKAATAGGN